MQTLSRAALHCGHSVRSLSTVQLVYSQNGDPSKVVSPVSVSLPPSVPDGHVRINWLAAPINPADINQIQGVYPVKPPLPAVGGNEGVGRVAGVGAGVKELREGDLVIPALSGLGTWRKWGDHSERAVWPIDKRLSLEAAALLQVNPSTAYRMLSDFVQLQPGDTVIQNGGTSGVGRAAMQICAIRGVKCISVVRGREKMDELREELTALGSSAVVTEEEMGSKMRGKVKARLALNCVGGRSSLFLAAALDKKGVMVTYGGMSKQPLTVPTASLIFSDVSMRGFWMSRWYESIGTKEERDAMYSELAEWFVSGKMRVPPTERVSIEDPASALDSAQNNFHTKLLFV